MGILIAGILGLIGTIIGAVVSTNSAERKQEADERIAQEQIQSNEKIAKEQKEIAEKGYQKDLEIANKNIALQQEINRLNLENQNKQNELLREREDNAVQRRANDLRNEGINPMLAGVQGAAASPGFFAQMQAPVADTTIGSNFARNIIDILSQKGNREQQIKQRQHEAQQGTKNRATEWARIGIEASKAITTIVQNKYEADLLKAKVAESEGVAKKLTQDILKSQADIVESSSRTNLNKEQQNVLKETILNEPIKRALMKAQEKDTLENIHKTQQAIKNMREEKILTVLQQDKVIDELQNNKQLREKISKEIENLAITGDILKFENNMKELNQVTNTSKSVVDTLVNIIKGMWFAK